MAGRNPAEALDAFLRRFRAAIRCIADADVYGSQTAPGDLSAITLYPRDGAPGNIVPLRMANGHRDLKLGVYHFYVIVEDPDPDRGPYKVRSSRYAYEIMDREEREILVFHWHPEGLGNTAAPHLHMSGIHPLVLPDRVDGSTPPALDVSNAHVPTGRTFIEQVIGLLIRDFGVESHNPDWARVLDDNLDAIARGRTW